MRTWNSVLCIVVAYLVTGIVSDQWSWQRIVLVFAGGAAAALWMSRDIVVTTTFGREGVAVKGLFGSGYYAPRWTRLRDISELLWQPEWSGDAESRSLPQGLYGRRGLTLVCLVPFLEAAQTLQTIGAIERRFSWIDRDSMRQGSLLFSDDLVRLDLESEG